MYRIAIVAALFLFAFAAMAQPKPAAAPAPAPAAAPAPAEPAAQPTCGQMMAEMAPLLEKMAEMSEGMAAANDLHVKALDKKDKDAKAEADFIGKMTKAHKDLAKTYKKAHEDAVKAKDMKACKHDEKTMNDPKMGEAMQKNVKLMKDVAELMNKHVAAAEAMMAKKAGSGGN